MSEITKILEKALDLLIEEGWGQGQSFKESSDGDVSDYCLLGAVEEAARRSEFKCKSIRPVYDRLRLALGDINLVTYNDAPTTTKEDMILLFKRAIHEEH